MKVLDAHGVEISIPIRRDEAPRGSGCKQCRFGLRNVPELRTSYPLYIERTIQASLGLIEFCDCPAGERYRAFLRTAYVQLQKDESYSLKGLQNRIAGESDAPSIHYEPAQPSSQRYAMRNEYLQPHEDEESDGDE